MSPGRCGTILRRPVRRGGAFWRWVSPVRGCARTISIVCLAEQHRAKGAPHPREKGPTWIVLGSWLDMSRSSPPPPIVLWYPSCCSVSHPYTSRRLQTINQVRSELKSTRWTSSPSFLNERVSPDASEPECPKRTPVVPIGIHFQRLQAFAFAKYLTLPTLTADRGRCRVSWPCEKT